MMATPTVEESSESMSEDGNSDHKFYNDAAKYWEVRVHIDIYTTLAEGIKACVRP